MARQKKEEGWFDLFLWLFTRYSAWLSIPIAIAVFIAMNVAVFLITSMHPVLKGFALLGPMLGGLAVVIVLAAAEGKSARRKIYDHQTSIDSIRKLSWSQFELLVGEAYRRQGYEIIETGGGGVDGGIDLKLKTHLETVIVQCKQWKVYKVGVKPIRELYGVLMSERADRAIFVTSGVYTREAQEFANGKPIELINGESTCRLITPVRQQQVIMHTPEANTPQSGVTKESQTCPACGCSMILRTARRGARTGSQFWMFDISEMSPDASSCSGSGVTQSVVN